MVESVVSDLLTAADNAFEVSDYQGAIEFYKKILLIAPEHDWAHYQIGCIYLHYNNIGAAINSLQNALAVNESKLDYWQGLFNAFINSQLSFELEKLLSVYSKKGENFEDFDKWESILQKFSGDIKTQDQSKNKVQLDCTKLLKHFNEKELSLLRSEAHSLSESHPLNLDFLNTYAAILCALGQSRAAILKYKFALILEPDNTTTLMGISISYQKTQKYALAISGYQNLLNLTPHSHNVMNNLGSAYNQCGRGEEAQNMFLRALTYEADNKIYQENLLRTFDWYVNRDPKETGNALLSANAELANFFIGENILTANNDELMQELKAAFAIADKYEINLSLSGHQIYMRPGASLGCEGYFKLFNSSQIYCKKLLFLHKITA